MSSHSGSSSRLLFQHEVIDRRTAQHRAEARIATIGSRRIGFREIDLQSIVEVNLDVARSTGPLDAKCTCVDTVCLSEVDAGGACRTRAVVQDHGRVKHVKY